MLLIASVRVCLWVGGWVSELQEVIANGTSVKLQFYRTLDADPAKASESEEGAATVLLHNVHQMPGTDEEVYAGVMRDHRVPPESEFSLRSMRTSRLGLKVAQMRVISLPMLPPAPVMRTRLFSIALRTSLRSMP